MKPSRIFRSLLLAGTLMGFSAQAADPQPPSAADLQALMTLLNKIVAQSAAAESAPSDAPEPAPTPPPDRPTPAAKAPAAAAKQPLSTALKTGSLSGASLAPSSGLDGRGAGTVARLTEEAWRLLFPAKQPGN